VHPWFDQYNPGAQFINQIEEEDIAINYDILEMLKEFNFDPDLAEKYIKANKHNKETTTYYLLLKKYEREGKIKPTKRRMETSVEEDERNMTQPPKYPQNLSVSQKIKQDLVPKSHLNQTLPVSSRISEGSANKSGYADPKVPVHQVFLETSRAEQQAGINVSYDNSFNAIKREIKDTVKRDEVPNVVPGSTKSTKGPKNIVDDLPPNKPNEAIMISESIKINDNDRQSLRTPEGRNSVEPQNNLNYTMPTDLKQDSIEDMKSWKKHSASRKKEHSTIEQPASYKTNINFSTVRDPTNFRSTHSNYQVSKPKTSINSYSAAMPKKKGHTTNFSYSSRPKTSNYLTHGKVSSASKRPQANSFMTNTIDSTKTPKNLNAKVKASESYNSIDHSEHDRKSPVVIEDPSSSARHSKAPKSNFRTIQEHEVSSRRDSELVNNHSSSVSKPGDENLDEMKTYRGPFSVS
jgi:hypothetical protein